MKCEKCNEREANFFYTATINGKTAQRRLCLDCAREEGFDQYLDHASQSLFDDFWGGFREPFGMLDSFFGGRSLFAPMLTMPRLRFLPAEPQACAACGTAEAEAEPAAPAETSGGAIPTDAGKEIKARRELQALKSQLKSALKEENYEAAIVLRDKIRDLEGK